MGVKKKRSRDQVAAMQRCMSEGKSLAKSHPEVADEWRAGATYQKLALIYLSHLAEGAGKISVGYAVRQLIPREERKEINRGRRSSYYKKLGKAASKNRQGLFGMSEAQRKLARSKGGRGSTRARGQVPYEDVVKLTPFGRITEKEYVKKLASLKKRDAGYTWEFIADLVNAIFDNNRKPRALGFAFYGTFAKQ